MTKKSEPDALGERVAQDSDKPYEPIGARIESCERPRGGKVAWRDAWKKPETLYSRNLVLEYEILLLG